MVSFVVPKAMHPVTKVACNNVHYSQDCSTTRQDWKFGKYGTIKEISYTAYNHNLGLSNLISRPSIPHATFINRASSKVVVLLHREISASRVSMHSHGWITIIPSLKEINAHSLAWAKKKTYSKLDLCDRLMALHTMLFSTTGKII